MIVVALGEDSGAAAKALAREVYADALLRPSIDEPTARVLAGSLPEVNAPQKLREMAELRASLLKPGSEVVARRLLTSLGVENGAALVVTVTLEGSRPYGKVLRSSSGAYERVELGATVELGDGDRRTFRWPGAAATLKGMLTPQKPAPEAPKEPAKPKESKPFWKSPWFWGTVGGVAATGLTVFILTRVTGGTSDVHLSGSVSP